MPAIGYAIFETAIGPCAIAWSERGIVGAQLPEGSADATGARMARRFGNAVERAAPEPVQRAIDAIVASLRGESQELADIALDMEGAAEFEQRVYAIARTIRRGSTMTYGEIATRLGDRSLARAVGQALGRNPFAPIVPCHRVLAANGAMGGFSARGGVSLKERMLAIEGAMLL
jgi:methylated-DNA-[protein]-cysteine S-methyltransferase